MDARRTVRDSCEVAVLGGGIAGLVAAWNLRDRDVVLLEADDRLGGRVKSLRRGDYYVNLGAQYMAGAGPLADIIHQLAIPTHSLAGSRAAIALKGRVLASDSPVAFVLRTPMSPKGRVEFARFGLRIRRMYKRLGENPDPQDARKYRDELDDVSIASLVDDFSDPDVRAIIEALVATWVGAGAEEASAATFVLDMGSALTSAAKTPNFSLPVGGNETIIDALASELGDRAITGAKVVSVSRDDGMIDIEYRDPDGAQRRLSARQCIVALPAHVALSVVQDLPAGYRNALAEVRYGSFTVAGIFTNEEQAQPWDSMYSIAVPHRSFQIIYNHAAATRRRGPRKAGGALVAYAGGDRARVLAALPDSEIVERFVNDLDEVFPGSRRLVDDIVVQRWPEAIPYWHPGDRQHIRQLRAPLGAIHFAGDYVSYPASMKAAAQAAEAASGTVIHALTA